MLKSTFFVGLMGITPQQVEDFLVVVGMVNAELDLKGSLDGFDSFDILDCWTDTSMATEDSLLLV